ncbi:MAG: hypothetical protein J6T10_29835 [Methanobrevibacter sp.]|nr:hypothetical protein [Methanobrevibacter sp.]
MDRKIKKELKLLIKYSKKIIKIADKRIKKLEKLNTSEISKEQQKRIAKSIQAIKADKGK